MNILKTASHAGSTLFSINSIATIIFVISTDSLSFITRSIIYFALFLIGSFVNAYIIEKNK